MLEVVHSIVLDHTYNMEILHIKKDLYIFSSSDFVEPSMQVIVEQILQKDVSLRSDGQIVHA